MDLLIRGLASLAFVTAAMLSPLSLAAQSDAPASNQQPGPLAVYLDCRAGCDSDYLRTEITYVDWVRDRAAADLHLLITEQGAGAGGDALTFAFIGLRRMAGRSDTLTYTTDPTTTAVERRTGVTRTIALGLVQFAARTSAGPLLRISVAPSGTGTSPQVARKNDPWDAWVFEVGVNGSVNGERAYRGRDAEFQLESRRVTEQWKTNVDYAFSYQDNEARVTELDSVGTVVSDNVYRNLQRDWRGEVLQVKSLTDHWSAAAFFEVASQTFRNQNLRLDGRLAAEYNIFPYAEATRREFVFRYGVGLVSYRYADTTVFDKLREMLPIHFFEASFRTRQPWGSAGLDFEHRNILTAAAKRSTSINGNFSVRVFKGLNLNAGGGYEWIRDQVYLPKGQQDAVDVLLRRRALLTGFQYRTRFGVSYTFGSIYNNVVNPRF